MEDSLDCVNMSGRLSHGGQHHPLGLGPKLHRNRESELNVKQACINFSPLLTADMMELAV